MKTILICIFWLCSIASINSQTTITLNLSSTEDDAYEQDNGDVKLNDDHLELGKDGLVGLRFQDVTIPSGAVISSAHIEFVAKDDKDDNPSSVLITADLNAYALNFSEADYDLSARSQTSNSVVWNFGDWEKDLSYNSPDISAVIQEIVDLNLWSIGNQMALIFEATGSKYRKAYSFDDEPPSAAKLVVTYTGGVLPTDITDHITNDLDLDPTNELNTSAILNGSDLEITDAGSTLTVDLSSLDQSAEVTAAQASADQAQSDIDDHIANDGDTDATNELQDWTTLPLIPADIADGDDVDDADADPTNELNQTFGFDGTLLELTDANGTLSADISAVKDNLGNHSATQNIELNGNALSNDGGNEGILINNDGNIGLNTNPDNSTPLSLGSNGADWMLFKDDGGVNKYDISNYTGNDFVLSEFGVAPRLAVRQGGNVGINTLDPQGTLHLYGNGDFGSGSRIIFGDDYLSSSNDAVLHIGEYGWENQTDTDMLDVHGDRGIHFTVGRDLDQVNYNSYETAMYISGNFNDRNVGIGTENPDAKLDIEGNIRIADGTQDNGRVLTSDGNGYASWQDLVDNVDDADNDPNNELQDWGNLPGIPAEIADGDDVDDADSDPTNELQDWGTLPGIPVDILDGDNVDDADADPANEFNTGLELFGTSLQVFDNGGIQETDLSSLKDNLGDHSATQILQMNNNPISNDGGFEGIFIDNDGHVGINTGADGTYNLNVDGDALISGAFVGTGGVQGNTRVGFNAMPSASGFTNSAFGEASLFSTTSGFDNTGIGTAVLYENTTGSQNSAMGVLALERSNGEGNTAIGYAAGSNITTGSSNTFLGRFANASAGDLENATAVGHGATVSQSNSLVLGNFVDVGIGTSAPEARLHVEGSIKMADGSEGAGKVLTSDTDGLASWQTPVDNVDDADNDPTNEYNTSASLSGTTLNIFDNGGSISVDLSTLPTAPEVDPEVGANVTNRVPVWDGTALVESSIYSENNNVIDPTGSVIGANSTASGSFSATIGSGNSATEFGSVALGISNASTGGGSTVVGGWDNIASGNFSLAGGRNSQAIGNFGFAYGIGTIASGEGSISIGGNNNVSSNFSTALGTGNSVSGSASASLGNSNTVSGGNAVALGATNTASGTWSTVTGRLNTASGDGSFAGGVEGAEAQGQSSFAFGTNAHALATSDVAIGIYANASGESSFALGEQSNASGYQSFAIGGASLSSGNASIAIGGGANSTNGFSTALGAGTTASGVRSTAIGQSTTASGGFSVAIGDFSTASGISSTTLGSNTFAIGDNSTAMGFNSQAVGLISTSMGFNTIAQANFSTATGNGITAANVGELHNSGDVRGASFITTSDERYKKNVNKISNGLEKIMQLQGVSYEYKDEFERFEAEKGKQQIGFIAQDVQKVLPELVSSDGSEEAYLGIRYANMSAVLVEAVKEQQYQISDLQDEIDIRDNRISQLEDKLDALSKKVDIIINGEETIQSATLKTKTPWIEQNAPNPFLHDTQIDYYIPENNQKAQIIFYDGQGRLIKATDIRETGKGTLTVKGGTLQAGTYYYKLVVDGVVIDTKKTVFMR